LSACVFVDDGRRLEEEDMVRATVGYAVAAALDNGASEELVRIAVDDAFSERLKLERV
jgi:hypothetical protein